MPQGTISYTNISYPKGGVYTQTLGVNPDRVSLYCIPQATPTIPNTGTITFSYNASSITLPNCFLDDVKVVSSTAWGHMLSLSLLDRRWRWHRAAPITGYYNVRRNGTMVAAKQKSLRQLAELLLQQMGEATPNVTALSNSIYPEVRWEAESPALMLEQLLGEWGFSVTLGFGSETVTVVQLGAGSAVALNTYEMMISSTVDYKMRPTNVRVCYGPSLMQARFKLEPVALETDDSWVAAGSVSYAPGGDWTTESPYRLPAVAISEPEDTYNRALKSVYRAYRIKKFAPDTLDIPDGSGTLSSIQQVLPLLNTLLDSESIRTDGSAIPFRIYGKRLIQAPSTGQPAKDEISTIDDEIIGERVAFYGETGLLIFENPQFYVNDDGFQFADLYLECSFRITSATTNAPQHYEKDVAVDAGGYGYYIVQRPETEARTVVAYGASQTASGTSSNQATLDTLASDIAGQVSSQFGTTAAQLLIYCQPILTLRCSGVIHQVQHIISDGTRHAGSYSTVAVNLEFDPHIRLRDERAALFKSRSVLLDARSQQLLSRRKESSDD